MKPIPKDISDEIFDRLNALTRADRSNEMLLKGISRDIEKLRSVDCVTYQLLGALASVRGQVTDMRRSHEAAIRLAQNSSQAHSNYACSLLKTGFVSESAEFMNRASKLNPSQIDLVGRAIHHNFLAGNFSLAAELLPQWNEGTKEDHPNVEDIMKAVDVQSRFGVTDTHTSALIELAAAAARAEGETAIDFDVSISSDDESDWITVTIFAGPNLQRAIELNAKYVNAVVESNLPSELLSAVVVRFTAAEEDANSPRRVA